MPPAKQPGPSSTYLRRLAGIFFDSLLQAVAGRKETSQAKLSSMLILGNKSVSNDHTVGDLRGDDVAFQCIKRFFYTSRPVYVPSLVVFQAREHY